MTGSTRPLARLRRFPGWAAWATLFALLVAWTTHTLEWPQVLAASLAPVTEKIRLRAGSVLLSLEHPLRVAEAWSVVDNLSGGRVDVAFGSGWNPATSCCRPPPSPRPGRSRWTASTWSAGCGGASRSRRPTARGSRWRSGSTRGRSSPSCRCGSRRSAGLSRSRRRGGPASTC